MRESPTTRGASVRVSVQWRESPAELAGHWGTCPRTGRLVRSDECSGCQHVEAIHLAGDGPAFIQCRVESGGEARADEARRNAVADIMSRDIVGVRASMPVDRLMLLLVDENIGGVPVIDDRGFPLGMVSKTDVLTELGERSEEAATGRVSSRADLPPGEVPPLPVWPPPGRTAADLMSLPLLTIGTSALISQAAALMTLHHVHRLGVADTDGRLVGIITASDIVRWLAGDR